MSTKDQHEFSREVLETLSYETPFFLFSKQRILTKLKEFNDLFPNSAIYYAMKANSEPEVLTLLAEAGCGFEVASKYELEMLKDVGVAPAKIIYGTSIKSAAHIEEFVKYGVDTFAFDSLTELEKLAALAPGARVYVRTIANDTGSVFKFSEKFGTDKTNIVPNLLRAAELGLRPAGISFHVGSQASDVNAWTTALESLTSCILELEAKGIKLELLNIGGGYPCRYASSSEDLPTLSEIAEVVMRQCAALPYQPKLILEPGRGIIAEAGVMVATVIARIERKGNTWLFLDAGVYNGLFEAMAYQGSTRYPVSSLRGAGDAGESLFALAGPTGDSPDIITREALLPQDTSVGDKLVIHNIGAYSTTTVSKFNGFPKPNIYYV